MRVELMTSGLQDQRSNHLSYGGLINFDINIPKIATVGFDPTAFWL